MNRSHALRGAAVCAVLFLATTAFAASYTSASSGPWHDPNTWGGAGVPSSGDDVTITSNHVVTMTGLHVVNSVTLDSTAGNKMLIVQGNLTVEKALPPAITINAPSPGSTNIIRVDGGTLETSNSGISISGGASASKLEFTSLGGIARFAKDVLFAGTAANAQIDFANSNGTLEIGGNLGSGGSLINSSGSTVAINGTGAQTINSHPFHNFSVNKGGGTATLNGPITVNGDFAVMQGVLDDGGQQISLNGGGTSQVTVGSLGVLKLGNSTTATTFPAPHGTVTLATGSAVVYQAGVVQSIDSAFIYDRLYLSTLGGTVNRTLSGASLVVNGELNIAKNGANNVTLLLNAGTLDANGDIAGDGTITVTTGAINIAGNWSSSAVLNAGTGSVTYDGGGAQSMLPGTYHDLAIAKSGGSATLPGNVTVNGDLSIASGTFNPGANSVTLLGDFTNAGSITANNATINLNGTAAQTWNSTSLTTVSTLQVNNSAGVTVGGDFAVTGSLVLNGGILTTGNNIFVDVLASVTRSSGWIVGELTMGMNPTPARRFHVGTSTAYLPVDVDSGSAGTVTIEAVEALHPARTGVNLLNRYWTLAIPSSATPLDSVVFNYNETDYTNGAESKFHLARYNAGWTQFGNVVAEASNAATVTNVSSYLGDWVVGQRGSLGAAGAVAVTSVNGGSNPSVGSPFNVDVQARHDNGTSANVTAATTVNLAVLTGSGSLGGTTSATINAGANSATIGGVTYDTIESGVVLRAAATAGDPLDYGDSSAFNVVSAPTSVIVTSINDSGPGTLRQAILDANSGACGNPCTITFSTSGEINLASPLPAITADDVTIDGYTAPGSSPNTNSFGLPSNAAIALAINGGGTVSVGFDIQATFVKISGFAIKNFTTAGVVFQGDNSGANVSGCAIGTDVTGTIAAPNGTGVLFSASAEASLGGFTAASRNVISGNTTWGVLADNGTNTIGMYGNYVGVKANLTAALPNGTGIKICESCSAIVGSASAGNVISGNTATGLWIAGPNVDVRHNYIGTAGSSNAAIPNATGIRIDATSGANIIGGPSPSESNTISGNTQNGILIHGDDTTIDNNVIGYAPDGVTAMGNGGSGIRLESSASRNVIGTAIGNRIGNNGNDGVTVATTGGIGNVVQKGTISGNSNRAIDLGDNGTTANDATDADTGANNLQNFPTISAARHNGGSIDVTLSLDSSAAVAASFYTFSIYKGDNSTPPQAAEYLGSSACLSGNVFANLLLSVPAGTAVAGNNVVATATGYSDAACVTPSEGTSELSPGQRIAGNIHWIAGSGNWETPGNWNPAIVPSAGDSAIIDATGTYTVTINSLASVATVHVGASSGTQTLVVPPSQSLSWSGGSTVYPNGVLTMSGNTLGGSGSLNVDGRLQWNSGTISNVTVNFSSGAIFDLASATGKTLHSSTVNIGNGATANWTGGQISFVNAGAIDNYGLFECKTDASIVNGGSGGTFDNFGTFRKSTTSGSTAIPSITFNHNAGTLELLTGTFDPTTGSAAAPITIDSGALFRVDDFLFSFGNGTDVSGAGKVHVLGGALSVDGTSVEIEHLQLDGGTLSGTGSATPGAGGTWVWNGGAMAGSGSTVIPNTATLTISTATTKSLQSRTLTVQNGGTVTVDGTGSITLSSGGNINNAGTFDIAADASLTDGGTDGGIINSGSFQKSAGSGTTFITNVDFNNSGTLKVLTGTLNPCNLTNTAAVELTGTLLVDDFTVVLSGGSDVSGSGLLKMTGGVLTVSAPDTLPNLRIDNGTLNGTATFGVESLLWNGGTMSGSGTTVVPATKTATISGAGSKTLQRTFNVANGATANVTGTGSIVLSGGGKIDNAGLIDFTVDGTVSDGGFDGGITNSGTLRKSGGTGSLSLTSVDLANAAGTLDIQSGTFNPTTVTSSGPIVLGGTFLVDDGTVTLNSGTDVSGSGQLKMTGGVVNAATSDTFPNVRIDGGTFQGVASVSMTSLLWNGGTMGGSGTTVIPNLASATIASASSKTLQRTFDVMNGGNVAVTGSGAINFSAGGNIANDGTIEVTSAVTFNDAGSAGDINNSRTFRTNVGTSVVFSGITFNNSGASALLDVVGGSVDLADGTSSASIAIAPSASLLVNSDTYTISGGTIAGGGPINLSSGTLAVTGNVMVPSLVQNGGFLDGTGTLTLTATSTWNLGTWQGSGTTTVANGATLNLAGTSTKSLKRTLSNALGGTVNVTGTGSVDLFLGGNITNAGAFNVTADNAFTDSGSTALFTNTGTFTKSATTGSTLFSGVDLLNNGGLIDLRSGVVTVSGDTFSQPSGTLKVWLNGTTPGTGHAQLSTNTTPTLGGTLEIALVGPYQPVGGNTFRILSATSRSGDFTQPYTYPALSAGRTFNDAYDASGLLLTVSGNADLSISKSAPANVLVGAPISYSLDVSNAGPDAAASVSVTDVLQTGHSSIAASGTGWSCAVSGLTVTCTAASLPTGAAPTITISANAPTTPQTFTNVASVDATNDANAANDSDSAVVTVDANQADLEVTSAEPAGTLAPGSPFTFDYTILNNGPQPATSVVFTATIPPTLTYNSATPGSGSCGISGSTVTCNVGNLAANANVHVLLNLTTNTAGTQTVTGNVTAVESDPDGTNNAIPAHVRVSGSTLTVTNVADDGMGSLRRALEDAQDLVCTQPCTIAFNIPAPPYSIAPLTDLPSIESQTVVDATTQPGYAGTPIIHIDAAQNALATGLTVTGNDSGVRGLAITGANVGIDLSGNGNKIEGSYVGLTPLGAVGANATGIAITGNNNTVGGTAAAQRNVISGNSSVGVALSGTANANAVSGNYIGTDAAGTSARNNVVGIAIFDDADANIIGGATAAHRNVISGNSSYGIVVDGGGAVPNANAIGSNSSGADAGGTAALTATTADGNEIRNNWIGPAANGTSALGATAAGIALSDLAAGTVLYGNVVSGHANAIVISTADVTGTSITGNTIGVAPDGVTPMANAQGGIVVADGATTNVASNTIAHNGGSGVLLLGGNGTSIAVNAIHDNAALGIDLGGDGVTANDGNDSDSGPNGLQNFPTLGSATLTGGSTVSLSWSLDSSGSTASVGSVRVEIFEADAAGEGKTFLTAACMAGNAFATTFSFNAPGVTAGDPIVATATSYSDAACGTVAHGTSEFSNVVNAASCTPPPVTITGPTAMCAGAPAITLDAGAGFASYAWNTGATTRTITVAPGSTTTYSVVVTSAVGCTNSDSHVVTVNPLPTVTITGPASVCAGGGVTLDAGAGFSAYLWNNGATTRTITVSPNATTTYSVTATDGNTCQASDSHTVAVTSNPTATITGPAETCAGTPVTLDAGAGFATYLWNSGETTRTIVVSPAATTTYGVTVGDGSCSASDTHTVTVNPAPAASITAGGPSTFCAGGSVTLTASGGTSWLWNNGGTTQSITVTASGTFSVQVFNGSCSATSPAKSVTVNPLPVVNITGPAATCDSSPVVLDAGPGFAAYAWSNGATSQSITVNPAATTTYSVTVTDGQSCSASDSHTVTVSTNPTASIAAPAAVCESSSSAASVAAQPGASYLWSITNGTIVSGQGTNAIAFQSASSGSITLGVTVTAGSCTSSGNATIPIVGRPSAAITAPATATPNQTGLTASVPAQGGATYTWSVTNGSLTSGQGTNVVTFAAGSSGRTTVTVSVAIGGCTESNAHQLSIDAPQGNTDADLAITKSAPSSVQPGGAIVYTIGVTNRGPLAASGVVVDDAFPIGTSFVSVDGGAAWNCTRLPSAIRCTGTMAASSSSSITLTLAAPQSGTVINTAGVFASTPDPDLTNNSASATTSVLGAPPVCTTVPPSLQLPAGGASTSSPVTFTWSAVAGATEYELWIDNSLAATTTATTLTRPSASGTFSWFVVARLGSGCDALTSASRTFTVAPSGNCPTQAPQITAPAHGASVGSPVTFFWTPVPQAIGYRVWLEANGTAAQDVGTTDAATTSLNVSLPTGSAVVFVEAFFSGCAPTRSAPIALTVPAPDPCAGRATASPLAPANAGVVNSSSVAFSWTPVARADGYRLWVSLDGGAPAVLGTTTSDSSLRATIGRGNVVWWVETLFDGCASTQSQPFRFTIPAGNDCTDARPELLAPARNAQLSNASVTFSWSSVPNAVSYELWVAVDNGTPALFGTTTGTSLTRLVPGGRIDWSVVAVIDRCGPRPSQQSRFTYAAPATCASLQRPTLVEPLNGADVSGPLSFSWNASPGATSYDVMVVRNGETSVVATTAQTEANGINLAAGNVQWFVRANFGGNCSPLDSGAHALSVVAPPAACSVLDAPAVAAPGQISSGVPFIIQWTPVSGATAYQLQLASSADFSGAQLVTTAGTQHPLVRTNGGSTPIAVHARVRAVDGRCRPVPNVSAYGAGTAVFILPASGNVGSLPIGGGKATFTIPLGSELAGQTFAAVSRQPWLTVSPASGVVGANGTILTVTANASALPIGTSLGGIIVTLSSNAAGRVGTNSSTTIGASFSVTLVTPVVENPKNTPPPDALIIPAVAHAGGINSQFQSDVRVSNTSPQLVTYQLTFTPSGDSGITDGQQSTFSIEPGRTVALDDVLKSWFGTGNGSAMGTLEIRPLTQTATSTSTAGFSGLANLLTFASSRTFNVTANGTFGQYIPAIPFANFVGRAADGGTRRMLSLQQIAQSSQYRTNLGLVEGSGEPASLIVRVFGASGEYLTEFPVNLKGGQHLQLNAFLRNQGVNSLSDGRVEVEVVGGAGKVTAYASVLDNQTSDPLLVTPVNVDDVGATKWVVPGVADLVSGFANWQTDMRLFNAGTSDVEATLSFYSQGGGQPKVKTLTVAAGQVRQFDRTLASLFETTNDGGAVHISTSAPAKLIATARTYNQTGGGTYGQFISAVTPEESAGVDSRPLQLLQVEETDRFRSNIGLVEVTGKPVTLELSVVPPDAKFTAVAELTLAPNEFRQLGSLLKSMGLGDTHNARVTVRAISGDGRVTAYASVIDMQTNDPTYVPAQ